MIRVGAHTFAWTSEFNNDWALKLFPLLSGTDVDFIEIASYTLDGIDPKIIRQLSADYNLPVALCSGMGAGRSLINSDPAIRERSIAHLKRILEFAGEIDAFKVSGPIYGDFSHPVQTPRTPEMWDLCVEAYRSVASEITSLGIPLSIEPLNRYQTSFLNTLADCQQLVTDIGVKNIGILADVFHAGFEEDNLYASFECHLPKISHVHFCGNNRGPLATCHIDWMRLKTILGKSESNREVTIETFNSKDPRIAVNTRTWREFSASSQDIVLSGASFLKSVF